MARKELSALNRDEPVAEPVLAPSKADKGLRVRNLARSFGQRQVVRDVSLTVQRGEVAGLLGPNGAGKTTCFYMITGLIPPDAGSIWLDGEDITGQPMYQRSRMGLGYLAQEASIFRGMTVEQNVKSVVELNYDRSQIAAETNRLLNELHIDHLRHAPATALSGGERRRVEIARALAGRPSFILLDEPFAGIDPLAIADIRSVIRYLASQGIGVLITDHNVRETLEITDRVSIISGGSVLFEGTSDEAIHDPEVRRVYLGEMYA
ncbi:LPS export ABC transporter ATP-binding protein [Brevundimonas nasdae]|uniref:Lipopolysaccharide export system ATP-binding protein LptB n=1 Tax=Brevundimonas nasdae TaxID=172043 RepID=A0ABX8TDM6_9CAUL|nr:LPS export ABC transporter ATP-binding protein [Brevundimonas nasdae]QYC09275.1 LPS export ABC transporter ATP-binding protein [Brevundimonas nasdae]QYC15324.1 LPS export ABC transporter ATP-binding protein [Brevundimonas nasdae]